MANAHAASSSTACSACPRRARPRGHRGRSSRPRAAPWCTPSSRTTSATPGGAPRSLERLLRHRRGAFHRSRSAWPGGTDAAVARWTAPPSAGTSPASTTRRRTSSPWLPSSHSGPRSSPAPSPALAVTLDDGRSVALQGQGRPCRPSPVGELVVSDYKTGRQGLLSDLMRDPVAGGRLLQLPVYALAAQARFGATTGADAARARAPSRYTPATGSCRSTAAAPCYRLSVTDPVLSRFRDVVRPHRWRPWSRARSRARPAGGRPTGGSPPAGSATTTMSALHPGPAMDEEAGRRRLGGVADLGRCGGSPRRRWTGVRRRPRRGQRCLRRRTRRRAGDEDDEGGEEP